MTLWFEREAGSPVAQGIDEPETLLLGVDPPDWVRLPPQLGGEQVRVVGAYGAPCPKCDAPGEVRHLALSGGLYVAECARDGCGFVFYARPKTAAPGQEGAP